MSQTTLVLLPQTHYSANLPPASGMGSVYQNTLTVTSISSGVIGIGQIVSGNGIATNTVVAARVTGAGGVGTYTVSPGITNSPVTIITTSGQSNAYPVIGQPKPAAAYYLSNKEIQTVNVDVSNLIGNVVVEASLYAEPSNEAAEPSNWFTVYKLVANAAATNGSPEQVASTTSVGINIRGNFIWMRARIEDFGGGIVNWVKVSY